ncbi:MAG TPA: retroviral-like aspartic protease family protein [Armatimonadota bacterium]|nr:retroviral-like aspartic protease family protein [Armatimonadota bacterium]
MKDASKTPDISLPAPAHSSSNPAPRARRPASDRSSVPRPSSSVRALIERAICAHGGRDALRRLAANSTTEGVLETFGPTPNTMTLIVRQKGKRYLFTMIAGPLEVSICSGDIAWKQLLGSVTSLSDAEKASQFQSAEHAIDRLAHAGEPGWKLSAAPVRTLPGVGRARGVRMTPPEGSPTDFYFDPDTDRVLALAYTSMDPIHRREQSCVSREMDYRLVDGLCCSFHTELYSDDNLSWSFHAHRIDLETPIDDAIFLRPAPLDDRGLCRASASLLAGPGGLLVEAILNEERPALLVLDTGCNVTTLWPETALALELAPGGEWTGAAVAGAVKFDLTRLGSIRIGEAIITDLDAAIVAPPEGLLHRPEGTPASDGILGCNFLSRFQVTVDQLAGRVELEPAATSTPFENGDSLEILHSVPVVHAQIGDQNLRLVLDTGSGITVLPAHLAPSDPEVVLVEGASIGMDGAALTLRLGQVSALTVAGQTLHDFVAAFVPENGLISLEVSGTDGLLGMDFLRRFKVTIDYTRQQIRLESRTGH